MLTSLKKWEDKKEEWADVSVAFPRQLRTAYASAEMGRQEGGKSPNLLSPMTSH